MTEDKKIEQLKNGIDKMIDKITIEEIEQRIIEDKRNEANEDDS